MGQWYSDSLENCFPSGYPGSIPGSGVFMEIVSKQEFLKRKAFFIKEMQKGKVFIYPTDTIYGIGCDATNAKSIEKIRSIKKRDAKPFSVIVPNKNWINSNCIVTRDAKKWIDKLPGKYTLILRLKNQSAISSKVNNGDGTLGARIPDNWFSKVIEEFGKPFITTSVNLSGEKPITCLNDLDLKMYEEIDYFIDEGLLEGKPSTIVNLIDGEEIINRN